MKDTESAPGGRFDPADSPAPGPAPSRILVVDDDVLIRRLNAEILSRHGYVVDMAEDGAAAWPLLVATRYDLLITDHRMPAMTGIELLSRLRLVGQEVPVIMASGYPLGEELLRPLWLQPVIMLHKPYTAEELRAAVRSHLRSSGGQPGRGVPFLIGQSRPEPSASSPRDHA